MSAESHDASQAVRRSWVSSANEPDTDFPIENLPFGVFRRRGTDEPARVGVAIGRAVLDVPRCHAAGLLAGEAADAGAASQAPTLNPLIALGRAHWRSLRRRLGDLLAEGPAAGDGRRRLTEAALLPLDEVELLNPLAIGDYTDFYASIFHATNVGTMLRPESPLLPNYKHLPIGYHGRASSIVVSGTPVVRPHGQTRGDDGPRFGSSRSLDYEVEVGLVIGRGNPQGARVALADAGGHMFGLCLVNDWSARDVQGWEYQPLGPFLAKSFATTISPWIVTMDALAPFRVPAFARPPGDPEPLAYLQDPEDAAHGGIDVTVEAWLTTRTMREQGLPPHRLSRSRLRDMYWTFGQMLAHHTSNGCNLRPGDLLASGTVSGPGPEARGCLLELTWRGTEPVTLPSGESRRFLEDDDEVVITAACEAEGRRRIGFGECRGRLVAARR